MTSTLEQARQRAVVAEGEVEPEGVLPEAPDAAMPTALAPRSTPEIINVLTIFAFMVFSESD